MKEVLNQKQKVIDLSSIDLNNLRQNQERELNEKSNNIKQLHNEIEALKEQIS